MKIAIIKYNAGNIQSVEFALNRLGVEAEVTDDFEKIRSADKVIFPGVGHAKSAMDYIRSKGLDKVIKELNQPVLGICLGMQLMCGLSEEGNVMGLEIFPYKVKRFPENKEKVPHIGWNTITDLKTELFKGINDEEYVYFVHSYYVENGADASAVCDYIEPFSAALCKDNFYATQFHPEKSGGVGAKILGNFLKL